MDVEIGGRLWQVEARRSGQTWVMRVNGRRFDVSAARAGTRWSLLVGPGDAPPGGLRVSRSYDVAIERRGAERLVHVGGCAVAVSRRGRRAPGGDDRQSGAAASAGPHRVTAPMPGRIVKVLVKPGDVVEANQPLVVVEAMKMENELRAPKRGTVSEVRVAEGALVDAKAVLVVVG
jgi:biotin carboxyl carrier protein